jgi:hypothetical protein
MKIYLAISTRNISKNLAMYKRIVELIEEEGNELIKNYSIRSILGENLKEDFSIDFDEEKSLMYSSDVIIFETSVPSFVLGALFGQSTSYKKPVLCFYRKNKYSKMMRDVIDSYNSSFTTTINYTRDNLEDALKEYLDKSGGLELTKFNFVANKRIVDFIEREAEEADKSKSEYLRNLIMKKILKD